MSRRSFLFHREHDDVPETDQSSRFDSAAVTVLNPNTRQLRAVVDHDMQTLHDDFQRFSITAAVEVATSSSRTSDVSSEDPANDFDSGGSRGNPENEFADGWYENPVAWRIKYKMDSDRLTEDMLFHSMDMKYKILVQYGYTQPEYIKWKLFGFNLVICFEYVFKGKPDKALEIIVDIENLLNTIGNDDIFLKSIWIALNHVTFSMKAYILKLCCLETQLFLMKRFDMPNDMSNINKAGLIGIQALFFYEYGTLCYQLSKDSALKAISLNETEPEWYFLLARILRNWAKSSRYYVCCEEEFQASKSAVEISNKNQYKLHLFSVYLRMYKSKEIIEDTKNKYLDTGLKLLNEVLDSSNDMLLLKYSLSNLSKVMSSKNINCLKAMEKLIDKLKTSDNGYVHGSIGNYYLFYIKDNSKALFHLKKAYDVKSFSCSIDYIYTIYKINSSTAPVEEMLVEMLKTFLHPIHQEGILSHLVSYLLITKNDLIRALIYIPMLLTLKSITCVSNLQNHKIKFHESLKGKINLLDILSEKLNAEFKDQTLSIDCKKTLTEVLQILESYKKYSVSILLKYQVHEAKSDVQIKNNYKKKEVNIHSIKQDISIVKNEDKTNWRNFRAWF